MKTKDLIGPALDWAVAKCEYDELAALNIQYPEHAKHYPAISPSTEWSWGGPIIEREKISTMCHDQGHWTAANLKGTVCAEGPTLLISAMRCYVASKLGDVVTVPEALL